MNKKQRTKLNKQKKEQRIKELNDRIIKQQQREMVEEYYKNKLKQHFSKPTIMKRLNSNVKLIHESEPVITPLNKKNKI